MERVICFFICIPLVFLVSSPIWYEAYVHHHQVSNTEAATFENGLRFDHPQQCATLSPSGIAVSIGSFCVLLVAGWFISKSEDSVRFRTWVVIFCVGCFLFNEAAISGFLKHKDNFFSLSEDKIEYKYGKREASLERLDIREIRKQSNGYVILTSSSIEYRIPNTMISKLNDNDRLHEILTELSSNTE